MLDLRHHAVALLAATVATLGTGPAHGKRPTPSDAWEPIGLTWELFEQLAKPERCLENRRLFMACVSGFRAAARSIVGERLDVWPARIDDRMQATSKQQWGRLVLGTLRLPTSWQLPASKYAEARALWQAWEREFGIALKGTLAKDFKTLSEYLRRQISTPKHVSKHTAKAVEGFLRSLHDPFARLVPLKEDNAQLGSEGVAHVGIGIELLNVGRAHVIERVITTGPAATYDLAPGDVVIAVDGWTTAGLPARAVRALLEGPPGRSVRIKRRRSGQDITFDITRAAFVEPHVTFDTFEADRRQVGWLNIASFHSQHVCSQTQQALKQLSTRSIEGLVVDLRGNPGGLLDEAVCVAGILAGPGIRVTRLKSDRSEPRYNREYTTAKSAQRVYKGPLAVLVNARSQSAAELLAGALRAEVGAIIVGQRTFGKGSVQDAMEWAPGVDVAMYRKVAQYLLAGDRRLHLMGIHPDIPITDGGRRRVTPAARADLAYWRYLSPPPSTATQGPNPTRSPECKTGLDDRWRARTRIGQLSADPQLFEALNVTLSCRLTQPGQDTP